jgi:hypothetical protein
MPAPEATHGACRQRGRPGGVRYARLWCHAVLMLAAVHIPYTVRRVGAATRPVTSAVNVSNHA